MAKIPADRLVFTKTTTVQYGPNYASSRAAKSSLKAPPPGNDLSDTLRDGDGSTVVTLVNGVPVRLAGTKPSSSSPISAFALKPAPTAAAAAAFAFAFDSKPAAVAGGGSSLAIRRFL